MQYTMQIAGLLRAAYFGGNWTWVNFKDTLTGVTWQQATCKVQDFNTIAALVYHTNYYVDAVLRFLEGEPLTSKDQFSFDHPPLASEEDWTRMLDKSWKDAGDLAALIEQLPDQKLEELFISEQYGNYYRNLHGIIEHCHYHLGQIVLIKKMLTVTDNKSQNPDYNSE